jgi:hypothetical protein
MKFKLHSSVVFSPSQLCNSHHLLLSEHLPHPKEKPVSTKSHSSVFSPPPTSCWQSLISSPFLQICLFLVLHINSVCIIIVFFPFTYCCSINQHFIRFYGWIIFHCTDIPILIQSPVFMSLWFVLWFDSEMSLTSSCAKTSVLWWWCYMGVLETFGDGI